MVSIEEDPRESAECTIGCVQWPATRGPSLDDEDAATQFTLQMSAALQSVCAQLPMSVPEVPSVSEARPPRWASIEDDEDLPDFMKAIAKDDEPIVSSQWPATRGPSLDEFA